MYIGLEEILTAGAVLGALGAIFGAVVAVVKWVKKPEDVAKSVEELKCHHNEDIALIKEELCVLNYAMLAALDGLKQLHCNGQVTQAYNALEKHLNKQAHDIHSNQGKGD